MDIRRIPHALNDLRLDDRNPLYREARCIHCVWPATP